MSTILSPNKHTGRLATIRLIVVHTMEVDETTAVAEAVGNAFANPARQASAHIGVDTDSECRYVPDSDTAWAAPGANSDGLQLELAGRAGQTTGQWTDAGSKAILERAALRVAIWSRQHDIPVRHLSDAQLADGKTKGIVGHDQVSRVFNRSDHWDPGPDFPWDRFLDRASTVAPGTVPPVKFVPPVSKPPAKPAPKPTGGLKVNIIDLSHASNSNLVRGPGVKPLQRLLGVAADGLGGAGTRAALYSYQKRTGLKPDSIFGPDTATAMLAGR